jgi:cysteine desulfurase
MLFKKSRIYADAAAATPLSPRSKRELLRLLSLYGNPSALHKEAVEAKKELENARKSIAESIGAHADEIIFTASGTEANNLAIHGAFGQGSALTIAIEHQSVLEPLRHRGLPVVELPVDKEGLVDSKQVAEAIQKNTTFVSIQLVNSEVGTIEPVREVAKILRRQDHKIYLHTDASQAPLWLDIKVERLGVDLMTLDAQKVLGPKGIGCLYVRRGTPLEPLLWGGKQERGLRGGTENVPLAGAFAVALADAQSAAAERAEKFSKVRDALWAEIKGLIPDAILHGPSLEAKPREMRVANNLSISIPGLDGEMAVIALDAEGIAVSTRSACDVGDEEPSHVLKALAAASEASAKEAGTLAKTAIRITLLPDATLSDAHRIARTLADVAKRYKE